MTKKIKIAYWFLILTMVLRICGAICVKPVHAHYQNDVYLNTVVQASSPVTSDCLVAEGQTVLLGYVERGMIVTIHFESDAHAYGVLDYYLVDETQAEYLSVVMRDQDLYLSGGTDYVNLYIMPTESAALLEADIDVDIFVSFDTGDQLLYATFRATLPGAVVEEPPEDDGGDENDRAGCQHENGGQIPPHIADVGRVTGYQYQPLQGAVSVGDGQAHQITGLAV